MEEKKYSMQIYAKELGGHTHLSIWTGRTGFTRGKAGDLIMTNKEFQAWKGNQIQIEFADAD